MNIEINDENAATLARIQGKHSDLTINEIANLSLRVGLVIFEAREKESLADYLHKSSGPDSNVGLVYQVAIEKLAEETNRVPLDIPREEIAGLMGVDPEELIGAATFCADCGHVLGANPGCDHCWPL